MTKSDFFELLKCFAFGVGTVLFALGFVLTLKWLWPLWVTIVALFFVLLAGTVVRMIWIGLRGE